MNVNLGEPFEVLLRKIVRKGYAGNQTEAMRQAIMAYDRQIEEEEAELVYKAVKFEMQEFKSKKTKGYSLEEIKKEAGF
ncbi:hypothetical protein KO317_00055 [Candidatus Micrarchaeota archaeon]|jgi:Arc/MetJ-type ribon-helix-helix transcriptional regulator|nr:hypothetical protein [Candidatus Micrarchaeota archaeon]